MRPTRNALLIAGLLLSTAALTGSSRAQAPATAAPTPAVQTRPAAPRPPAAAATPASYWGPGTPAAPKRKPTSVRRLFNRIGAFLGADEEMGTTPTFRDPTTGRTNTGASKPYMKPLEK